MSSEHDDRDDAIGIGRICLICAGVYLLILAAVLA